MKKPDDFELFHQRRKRKPLAEITNASKIQKDREKAGLHDGRYKLNNNMLKLGHGNPNSRGNIVVGKISKDLAHGATSKHENQENVDVLANDGTKKRAILTFGKSGISEKARIFLKNSKSLSIQRNHQFKQENQNGENPVRIPITHIRQLVSVKSAFEADKSKDPYIPKPLPFRNFESRVSKESEQNTRYKLLQSLIDYNALVEKSNRSIRTFFDQMRLSETKPSLSKLVLEEKHESKFASPDGIHTTLARVTKIGPFLWAATISEEEEILLMNTHEIQIVAGNKLVLEEFYMYELAGFSKKAFYKWRVI